MKSKGFSVLNTLSNSNKSAILSATASIYWHISSLFIPIKSTGRAAVTNSFSNDTASRTISSNSDYATLLVIKFKSLISESLSVPLLNLSLSVLNINAEKLKCIPSSLAIQSLDNANPGSNPLFLK